MTLPADHAPPSLRGALGPTIAARAGAWWTRETERCDPLWGRATVWVLLAVCGTILLTMERLPRALDKGATVSLAGLLLPRAFIDAPLAYDVCRIGFVVAAVAWAARRWVPWTSWAAVLLYTLTVSLFWENLPYFRHKYLLPNLMLIVAALWETFERPRGADRGPAAFERARMPRWVHTLWLLCIAQFYTYAGLAKLRACGPAWADGLSLQLWMLTLGDPHSALTHWIVADRRLALACQAISLALECSAFLVFVRPLRVPLALALTLLHVAIDATLHIPFLTNVPLLWMVLAVSPCDPPRWLTRVRRALRPAAKGAP